MFLVEPIIRKPEMNKVKRCGGDGFTALSSCTCSHNSLWHWMPGDCVTCSIGCRDRGINYRVSLRVVVKSAVSSHGDVLHDRYPISSSLPRALILACEHVCNYYVFVVSCKRCSRQEQKCRLHLRCGDVHCSIPLHQNLQFVS